MPEIEATEPDLITEVEELLAKATPGPLDLIRYEQGGGRLWHEPARTLVADFYNEGDRELYSRTDELLRRLVDEVKAHREHLEFCFHNHVMESELEKARAHTPSIVEANRLLDEAGYGREAPNSLPEMIKKAIAENAALREQLAEAVTLTEQEKKVLTDYHYYEAEKAITRRGDKAQQQVHLERLATLRATT